MDTRVCLKGQENYDIAQLKDAVDALVEPLGGWSSILSKGDRVILKPNLVAAFDRKRNVTTDPALVEVIIRTCLDFDCEVRVADASVFGSAASNAKPSGLLDVCRKYQVPLETLRHAESFSVGDRSWTVSADLKWATKIINLPKLKGHGQLYFTGAVKNLFGCVVGRRKFCRHMTMGNKRNDFGQMLLDTARRVAPALQIIDGIGAMAGQGPINGKPIQLSLLAASRNPLSLDCAIVDLLSGDRERISYFRAAQHDEFWQASCSPQIVWVGESFVPQGFFFPKNLYPVRFSAHQALRSVTKATLLRLGMR